MDVEVSASGHVLLGPILPGMARPSDRKRCRGKFEYLVQYKGYPLLKDCQWRPHDELSVTAPIILDASCTHIVHTICSWMLEVKSQCQHLAAKLSLESLAGLSLP